MSSSGRPAEPTAGSMLLDALLQPGSSVSRGALSFLDKIFIALFACIFFLIWLTNGREFHTYVFLFLAAGLVGSVKFFVSELRKAEAAGSIPLQGGASQAEEVERARLQEQVKESEARALKQQQEEIRRRGGTTKLD